ncbi:MAG: DUF4412 domain-containing protein [Candidatus Binatus sp.]|uniref:DUF4412 domain-containing protein n=1 Tax=Candidatus Binatus sp. TaxID=2811406 RepID=UPI00271BB35B|nr:DUF4412 domain-containing protein [Candidatus Binatus sp.]MDO8433432.1 DUF4412 domain-containing protein [Candidatus Binatus sp.]
MNKLTPMLAGAALALTALPAIAGVVITQKQSVVSGPNNRDAEQTVMLQGNKQKMITDKHTIITDLDKGMVYILDPKVKSYFQIDFPPKGQMAAMMAASAASSMNFKKGSSTRDIAGYKCTDYDGGGHVMAGDYTIKECFSKNAPGASEYSAFQKNMTSKLKASGAAPAGMGADMPDGVPLASDSTMKMGNMQIPGMSAEQAAKINQMMANRPPVVTKTVVTKIAAQNLPDDTFAVPAGFTKKELPQGPGGMGGMHMGGAPAGGSGMHMGAAPAPRLNLPGAPAAGPSTAAPTAP